MGEVDSLYALAGRATTLGMEQVWLLVWSRCGPIVQNRS